MTCTIVGPGLVGTYLGIAAGAGRYLARTAAGPVAACAHLPHGARRWTPRACVQLDGPVLVTTRIDSTPWDHLPGDAIAAQNGLGQPRQVAVCFMAIDRDPTGCVRHVGPVPRIVLARPSPQWTPVLAAWREAGLQVDIVGDVRPAQWEKVILNASLGPLCLATGLSMAAAWADAELRTLVLTATAEGECIARASGITISPGLIERSAQFFAGISEHRPSVLKHTGELDWILTPLLASAHRHGIVATALERIAHLVAASGRLAEA